jgi:hypothetical protein
MRAMSGSRLSGLARSDRLPGCSEAGGREEREGRRGVSWRMGGREQGIEGQ